MLYTVAALIALACSAAAPASAQRSIDKGGRTVNGPVVTKFPPILQFALPDLTIDALVPCGQGMNWRLVEIVNNGNAASAPCTLGMTWVGYDAWGHLCAKFFAYSVDALAPGQTQLINVDPGFSCWQYQPGSHVTYTVDCYNTIWESSKQNNSWKIDN